MIMKYKGVMRAAVVVLLILTAALNPMGIYAEDIFSEISKLPQVESTYVSGLFAHNKQRWRSRDGELSVNLSSGFSALYTYQCYSEESVSKAQKILDDYLKNNPDIEMVMRTKQDFQEYTVYEKFQDDGKVVQMLIWRIDSPNMCEIAVIDWDKGFDREENQDSE